MAVDNIVERGARPGRTELSALLKPAATVEPAPELQPKLIVADATRAEGPIRQQVGKATQKTDEGFDPGRRRILATGLAAAVSLLGLKAWSDSRASAQTSTEAPASIPEQVPVNPPQPTTPSQGIAPGAIDIETDGDGNLQNPEPTLTPEGVPGVPANISELLPLGYKVLRAAGGVWTVYDKKGTILWAWSREGRAWSDKRPLYYECRDKLMRILRQDLGTPKGVDNRPMPTGLVGPEREMKGLSMTRARLVVAAVRPMGTPEDGSFTFLGMFYDTKGRRHVYPLIVGGKFRGSNMKIGVVRDGSGTAVEASEAHQILTEIRNSDRWPHQVDTDLVLADSGEIGWDYTDEINAQKEQARVLADAIKSGSGFPPDHSVSLRLTQFDYYTQVEG